MSSESMRTQVEIVGTGIGCRWCGQPLCLGANELHFKSLSHLLRDFRFHLENIL